MAEPVPVSAPVPPDRICIIDGCTNPVSIRTHASICETHWFKLPMDLRKRWWKETAYGRRDPSGELLARINKTLANPDLPTNPPAGVTKTWADPMSKTPPVPVERPEPKLGDREWPERLARYAADPEALKDAERGRGE